VVHIEEGTNTEDVMGDDGGPWPNELIVSMKTSKVRWLALIS